MLQLDKRRVGRQFGKAAESYDDQASLQLVVADRLIELMQRHVGAADNRSLTLVDLGCGTGYALRLLAERYPNWQFFGVDLSGNMLAQASVACPSAQYLQADMESLPLLDGSVDVVFSSSSLQWCEPHLVFPEIGRILKPGGKLFLSSYLHGTLSTWRAWWMSDEQRQQQFLVSEQQFLSGIRAAHLEVLDQYSDSVQQSFLSYAEALASVRCVGAGSASRARGRGLMGKDKYRTIRKAIDHTLHTEGAISMPYEVIYLVGAKAT